MTQQIVYIKDLLIWNAKTCISLLFSQSIVYLDDWCHERIHKDKLEIINSCISHFFDSLFSFIYCSRLFTISLFESKCIGQHLHILLFVIVFSRLIAIIHTKVRRDINQGRNSWSLWISGCVTLWLRAFHYVVKRLLLQRPSLRPWDDVSIDQRICLLAAHR